MRYWWVNQKQTFRHEFAGGYLWSPKRKSNGQRNPFYEFMREVSPGDLVFSFADAHIRAFGLAQSYAYEAPKPEEFGTAGRYWDQIGWRVDVRFQEVLKDVRPSNWMALLGPLMPKKYAPLRPNGHGVQAIYLTELDERLALTLADLVGPEVLALARGEVAAEALLREAPDEVVLWEDHLRREIERDPSIPDTDRQALVLARRGQGTFRNNVQRFEAACRVTGVQRREHLRASHSKPWRDSTNAERLDGENGLLLTPSIDHLYDRGFISFERSGRLLVSPVAQGESLERMGVPVGRTVDVGRFSEGQGEFLEWHRDMVFLRAEVRRG